MKTIYLPTSWSPKDREEWARDDAAAAFSRAVATAVADTGVNFQLNDAGRTKADQIALFKENYQDTKRRFKTKSTDRWYGGTVWARRPDSEAVASPDLYGKGTGAMHTKGLAFDIAPAETQEWFRKQGSPYGFSWDEGRRNNEPWHHVYVPGQDRYRSRGYLDHAWVQKVVGAEVDGKIGTGTVAKIREFQKAHGLTPDGIVGPKTEAKMLEVGGSAPAKSSGGGSSKSASAAPAPSAASAKKDGGFTYTYLREEWDTRGIDPRVHPYDAEVEGIYLHYPGSPSNMRGESVEEVTKRLRGYRQMHMQDNGWFDFGYGAAVDWQGNVYQGRGLDMEPSSNGGSESNSGAGSIMILVGNREAPTAKQIAAVNALLAEYGAKYGKGFIRGHKQSPDASTACPGAKIMALIEDGTFSWDGKGSVPAPSADSSVKPDEDVVVDGRFGHDTVEAFQDYLISQGISVGREGSDGKAGHDFWKGLQTWLGTPVDGKVSNQSYKAEEIGNGITQGWDYDGRGAKGSKMVKALQKKVGVKADGIWFEGTTAAVQRYLNKVR